MLHRKKGESEMKLNMKRNYLKEKGITLIALVVTMIVPYDKMKKCCNM